MQPVDLSIKLAYYYNRNLLAAKVDTRSLFYPLCGLKN